MAQRALAALLMLCPLALPAALPEAVVALVDQARVEQETMTFKRLQSAAQARTDLKPEQLKESLDLVLSEILTVLPDAVATVAKAQQLDLVVQSSAWPADVESPSDATAAVIAEIDRRLAKLQLVVP